MAAVATWYWWARWRRRAAERSRWLLRALLAASPFGFIALQAGWMVTEFGRQPWIVVDYLLVSQAATTQAGIPQVFGVFVLVYLALTAGLLWLLPRRPRPARTGTLSGQEAGVVQP